MPHLHIFQFLFPPFKHNQNILQKGISELMQGIIFTEARMMQYLDTHVDAIFEEKNHIRSRIFDLKV